MTPIVITFVVLVILLVVLIKEEGKSHPSSGLCFRRGAEADTYQRFGSCFSVKDKGYATQYTGGAVWFQHFKPHVSQKNCLANDGSYDIFYPYEQ
jgi:hypothetical protein